MWYGSVNTNLTGTKTCKRKIQRGFKNYSVRDANGHTDKLPLEWDCNEEQQQTFEQSDYRLGRNRKLVFFNFVLSPQGFVVNYH